MNRQMFILKDIDFVAFKNRSFVERMYILCLIVGFAFLPWSVKFNSASILIAVALCFVIVLRDKIELKGDNRYILILSVAYYLIHVLSLLYTENLKLGFFYLEKNFLFLFGPLLFCVLRKLEVKRVILLDVFGASVGLAMLVCFVLAFKNNYDYNIKYGLSTFEFNKWFYSYHLLSQNISIHPSYLACFISIVILYISTRLRTIQLGLVTVVTLLFICLVQLSARSILFSTVIFFTALLAIGIYNTRNYRFILLFGLVFGLVLFAVYFNDISRSRILQSFDFNDSNTSWGSASLRLKQWKSSIEVIRNNYFWGVGFGDVESELVNIYRSKNWNDLAEAKYNSHNQFLQTTCGSGAFGILILVSLITISFRKAIITQDTLYLGFLIVFFLFSMTESTLEVQKGIVYFNFFNSMFFFMRN